MEMSTEINELAGALAKAQAEIEGAKKDGHNPHFRSSYSTLAAVWDACREPLSKHGLSIVQGASANGADVTITTLLLHTSGQWVKETLQMVGKDHNPQSVGSIISYGRRYQLAAMVGIAPEDDDAEAAEGRAPNVERTMPARPQNQQRPMQGPPVQRPGQNPPQRPPAPRPLTVGQPVKDSDIPF
jgi:hypothetical protein